MRTPENSTAAAYARGVEYNRLKGGRGGDQTVPRTNVAEALAAEYKVDPKTVLRSGVFAAQLDALAAAYGWDFRQAVFKAPVRLAQKHVAELIHLPAEVQQQGVLEFLRTGRLRLVPTSKKSKQVAVRLSDEEYERLLTLALADGRTMSNYLRHIINTKSKAKTRGG